MFSTSTSDIDLCLELPTRDRTRKGYKKKTVFKMSGGFKRHPEFGDIVPIAHARVPIVKMRHMPTNIECDICIDNMLATRNTGLLRGYAQADVRVRALGIFVKTWAKIRKVKQSDQGTLSSYAWILLVVAYLQRKGIVPSLQDERLIAHELGASGATRSKKRVWTPTERNGDLDTTFCESQPEHKVWRAFKWCDMDEEEEQMREVVDSTLSLGELIFGFFWFYGMEFNFKKACSTTKVSTGENPVYGRLLSKRKRWGLKTKPWRVSVEDPFEDWHDLGQVVNPEGKWRSKKSCSALQLYWQTGHTLVLC